jgi:hypothetical protein
MLGIFEGFKNIVTVMNVNNNGDESCFKTYELRFWHPHKNLMSSKIHMPFMKKKYGCNT